MTNSFPIHSVDTALEASVPLLESAPGIFGSVLNLMAVMAQSRLLLEGYQQLYSLGNRTHYTVEELQVVYMTISYERDCSYCMAAHSF